MLVCMMLSSCTTEDYSCDPEINKWVNENIDDIHSMVREEWMEIGNISKQRGAYGAFSINQKIALWKGKFEETLDLDWTDKEYDHIKRLLNVIQTNPDWYSQDAVERIQDQKDLFAQAWLDYAVEELKWSHELIYAIAFTPERLNINKKIISAPRHYELKTKSEIVHDCDCNNPESANFHQCGTKDKTCIIGKCKEQSWKCGWLWTYPCNGMCYSR